MSRNEEITVAQTTAGKGASGRQGRDVSLPVVELLTGRGFVTGKSGSGKSNTASVVAEELLGSGFGLLIVDVDGEYYGLKEEFEILHAGADEECDVRVTPDHAEKLASLALERNVPIILDLSSFLEDEEAEAVLTAVAKHLFAKAKKQKQPFLLLVEEVHEYIPENGSVGEAGKMLIKIGKRGRKHGLGVCGISQRPADVKKDFITQCDWLVWHRLTWNNDTKVVRRVLDGEYASAVESLDDGEGFLVTDWSERVRRVQFHRKRTFDAGATPGLEDFDRPDLKSVSDDLVEELATISEERQAHEDRIGDLRETLDEKNSRIAELEAELQDARDLSRMADRFVDALLGQVEGAAPGRTERGRQRDSRRTEDGVDASAATTEGTATTGETATTNEETPAVDADDHATDEDVMAAFGAMVDGDDATSDTGQDGEARASTDGHDDDTGGTEIEGLASLAGLDGGAGGGGSGDADSAGDGSSADSAAPVDASGQSGPRAATDGGLTVQPFTTEVRQFEGGATETVVGDSPDAGASAGTGHPSAVDRVGDALADLDEAALAMAAIYRDEGPERAEDVYREASGRTDRMAAYARNRALRRAGLIEHVGRGHYDYCLRASLEAAIEGDRADRVDLYATDLEDEYLD